MNLALPRVSMNTLTDLSWKILNSVNLSNISQASTAQFTFVEKPQTKISVSKNKNMDIQFIFYQKSLNGTVVCGTCPSFKRRVTLRQTIPWRTEGMIFKKKYIYYCLPWDRENADPCRWFCSGSEVVYEGVNLPTRSKILHNQSMNKSMNQSIRGSL